MKPAILNTLFWNRAALGFLALLFSLPGLLTLVVALAPESAWTGIPGKDWLRNRTLWTLEGRNSSRLTWKHLFSLEGRRDVALAFDGRFAGRECLARLLNEVYFRLFNESTLSDRFTFGRPGWVFETAYLREYFLSRPDRENLKQMVHQIEALQTICRNRGMGFAFVITPNKASIYPEKVPSRWENRYDPRPRGYDLLLELLKESRVVYVDGPAIARQQIEKGTKVSAFPRAGSHWGSPLCLATTNALIEKLRAQGIQIDVLKARHLLNDDPYTRLFDSDKEGFDADVLSATNLAWPWRFPVIHCQVLPVENPPQRPYTGVFVSGSFAFRMINQMMDSGQFDQIDCYSYYDFLKSYREDIEIPGERRVKIADFQNKVFPADFLVLELNEQRIPDPKHLRNFLADVFKNLPDTPPGSRPFLRHDYSVLGPGQRLSFSTGNTDSISLWATSGLSGIEETYCWTDGKEAGIYLLLPTDSDKEIVLKASVEAFLPSGLDGQEVEIFVNGEKTGEWIFTPEYNRGSREIVLPTRLINGEGYTSLNFRIARPSSPHEHGLSADRRMLGFRIWDLCRTKTPNK